MSSQDELRSGSDRQCVELAEVALLEAIRARSSGSHEFPQGSRYDAARINWWCDELDVGDCQVVRKGVVLHSFVFELRIVSRLPDRDLFEEDRDAR